MFTGIVEKTGKVVFVTPEGGNQKLIIQSDLALELKVDQSVNHNGVCLTVEKVFPEEEQYQVSAIEETLKKTNLGELRPGDSVNLERSVTLNQRLDGHIVQGHIDGTTECLGVDDRDGSYVFSFHLPEDRRHLMIPQGSVALDGISLTIAELGLDTFSVAIIPYTYSHTIIAGAWKAGKRVNIEYDVFGKYFERYMSLFNPDAVGE